MQLFETVFHRHRDRTVLVVLGDRVAGRRVKALRGGQFRLVEVGVAEELERPDIATRGLPLVELERDMDAAAHLDAGAARFAVAHREVNVAGREERAGHVDG